MRFMPRRLLLERERSIPHVITPSLSLFQLLYAIRDIVVVFHHGRQKEKGTQVWTVSQSSVTMTDAKAGTIICWILAVRQDEDDANCCLPPFKRDTFRTV